MYETAQSICQFERTLNGNDGFSGISYDYWSFSRLQDDAFRDYFENRTVSVYAQSSCTAVRMAIHKIQVLRVRQRIMQLHTPDLLLG